MGGLKRVNLLLAIIVAGLGAALWWDHAPIPAPAPLTALDPAAVRELRIERQDQPPIALHRDAGQWHMDAPWRTRADGFRVERLLGVLRESGTRHYALAKVDAQALGLDPPRARLIADGTPLAFGDRAPLDMQRYVRVGDRVHLVDDRYLYQLNSRATDYVDPGPIPPGADLDALTLPGLDLRRGEHGWRIDTCGGPPPDPATHSADAPQQLIDAWRAARAGRVEVDTGPAPVEQVALTLRDGTTLHYGLRRANDGIALVDAATGLARRFDTGAAKALLELPLLETP